MGDLIDRKAILKHIEKIRQDALTMDDIRRASIIMNGMDLCEKAVRNQPSAQSDIIRCKDCIWWYENDCIKLHGLLYPDEDDYCSKAERRPE